MVTDDEMYDTLRALLNTGFNTPVRIAKKVSLPLDLVEEALELALSLGLVKATEEQKDYMLNSSGELQIHNDSLRKIVEYNSQAFHQDAW